MQLQGAGGDHAGNGPLDGAGNDVGLAGAGGQEEAAAAFDDGADPHGDGAARHLVFPAEEWPVLLHGGGRKRLNPGAGVKGGKRLVEADMPGLADAEDLQVDPAAPLDGRLVAAAFLVQVAREAIGQVGVPRVHVHVAEQVVIHVVPVRVRVGREQADILVQIERAAE